MFAAQFAIKPQEAHLPAIKEEMKNYIIYKVNSGRALNSKPSFSHKITTRPLEFCERMAKASAAALVLPPSVCQYRQTLDSSLDGNFKRLTIAI